MRVRFVGIRQLDHAPSTAVVVDVMRAFTVAAVALHRGADRVILAGTTDEIAALKARQPDVVAVTDGPPVPGFDAVNSPAFVSTLDVSGRTVAQKTTAGTVGALAARHARRLLCASFVVADATAHLIRAAHADDVTFVITGTDGHAEEDLACAEYIARRIVQDDVDVAPYLRTAAHSAAAAELDDGVRRGHLGVHPDDVALCLQANRFPFAMVASVEDTWLALRARPVDTRPIRTPT